MLSLKGFRTRGFLTVPKSEVPRNKDIPRFRALIRRPKVQLSIPNEGASLSIGHSEFEHAERERSSFGAG